MSRRDKLQPEEIGVGLRNHFKPDSSVNREIEDLLARLGTEGIPLVKQDESPGYIEPRP